MIYTPNSALDARMVGQSRDMIREALALLRDSDHLVSAQRLRDELGSSEPEPARGEEELSDRDG